MVFLIRPSVTGEKRVAIDHWDGEKFLVVPVRTIDHRDLIDAQSSIRDWMTEFLFSPMNRWTILSASLWDSHRNFFF